MNREQILALKLSRKLDVMVHQHVMGEDCLVNKETKKWVYFAPQQVYNGLTHQMEEGEITEHEVPHYAKSGILRNVVSGALFEKKDLISYTIYPNSHCDQWICYWKHAVTGKESERVSSTHLNDAFYRAALLAHFTDFSLTEEEKETLEMKKQAAKHFQVRFNQVS